MAQSILRGEQDLLDYKPSKNDAEAMVRAHVKSTNCDEIQPGLWLGMMYSSNVVFIGVNRIFPIFFDCRQCGSSDRFRYAG